MAGQASSLITGLYGLSLILFLSISNTAQKMVKLGSFGTIMKYSEEDCYDLLGSLATTTKLAIAHDNKWYILI